MLVSFGFEDREKPKNPENLLACVRRRISCCRFSGGVKLEPKTGCSRRLRTSRNRERTNNKLNPQMTTNMSSNASFRLTAKFFVVFPGTGSNSHHIHWLCRAALGRANSDDKTLLYLLVSGHLIFLLVLVDICISCKN